MDSHLWLMPAECRITKDSKGSVAESQLETLRLCPQALWEVCEHCLAIKCLSHRQAEKKCVSVRYPNKHVVPGDLSLSLT